MPDLSDVAEAYAEKEGVCARVVPMRAFDTNTGRVSYVGAPCKATVATTCPACARANKYVRVTQLNEGWCAEHEPVQPEPVVTEAQSQVLAARADLFGQYHDARREGDHELAEDIKTWVADLDVELRELGVRGRLPALDGTPRRKAKSTRRRDGLPDLPRKKVARTTIGAAYAGGKYRPSIFQTLTMDSYGGINRVWDPTAGKDKRGDWVSDGSPVDPDGYDYARAARDIMHTKRLFDRWIQNLRRGVGWNVQYFATVEPQKRGAPHLHIAIRGSISKNLLYAVTDATYVNIWWPHFDPDNEVYSGERWPVWDHSAGTFVDPKTKRALTYWDDAIAVIDSVDEIEPAHTMRFGGQSKPIQILAGTPEMNRKVGYLTKYLTKSVAEVLESDSERVNRHYDRLHAELQRTPCSDKCAVWLRYGIVPKGATEKTQPGRCRGKNHRRDLLGVPGKRCLTSGQWSGKTLPDHKADRLEFVRNELAAVGIIPPDTSHLRITPVGPGDRDAPPRSHLIIALTSAKKARRAEYDMARLARDEGPPGDDPVSRETVAAQQDSTSQMAA
ncbi:helitron helicase-like domain-containing protein [Nocardia noduli]|uniref:helitron helicase-like domain-containing protein n=1 Tax=Nocardia noduli TaxID=2815722 RepID=UPI001C22C0E6|nr:helitron helicase-like domain-containing protein [Nocardia noduli]